MARKEGQDLLGAASKILGLLLLMIILTGAGIGAVIELQVMDNLETEHQRRIETLPALLVISNQEFIISHDVSSLQQTIDLIFQNQPEDGDLVYLYFIGRDWRPVASGYARGREEMRAPVERALRGLGEEITTEDMRHQVAEGATDVAELTERNREELPEGVFPALEGPSPPMKFSVRGTSIIDIAVPIMRNSRVFGAVHVGFRDDLASKIRTTWIWLGLIFGSVIALSVVLSIVVGRLIEDSADNAMEERLSAMRRRLQQQFAAEARTAEVRSGGGDSPLSPEEFFTLLDIGKRIGATLDYNEILEIAIHAALQSLRVKDASIFLMSDEGGELVGRIGHDETGLIGFEEMSRIRVPVGQGDIGMAAEFGTTTIVDTPRPGSAVVSALVTRGKVLGVLMVRNKINGRPFLKNDSLILRLLGVYIANGLENAALYAAASSMGVAEG